MKNIYFLEICLQAQIQNVLNRTCSLQRGCYVALVYVDSYSFTILLSVLRIDHPEAVELSELFLYQGLTIITPYSL